MEKFSLGPDAFDRPGGLTMAMQLFSVHQHSLKTISITLREPRQLGATATQQLLQSLSAVVALEKLGMGHLHLTGSSLGHVLANVLTGWSSSLQEIRISTCGVDLECMEPVLVALPSLQNLQVLVFDSCTMWQEAYFCRFLQSLAAPAIQLTELCLSNSGLTPASLPMLVQAFGDHPQLNCLNLSGNNHLLKINTVRGSLLDPQMVRQQDSFWNALQTLQNLQCLYLHQCGLHPEGARRLFQSVERMPRLQSLMIHDNHDSLRDTWTRSLPRITGLTHLWIGRQIPPYRTESELMMRHIRGNTSLLDVRVSGYSNGLVACLAQTVARNEWIRRARGMLPAGVDWPVALMAPLISCLLSSSLDGDATAGYLVLRSTLARWTCYATLPTADSTIFLS